VRDAIPSYDRNLLLIRFADLLHWPAPMTKDWNADKSGNWLDTWRLIEKVYREHPNKVKAIGAHLNSRRYLSSTAARRQVSRTSPQLTSKTCLNSLT